MTPGPIVIPRPRISSRNSFSRMLTCRVPRPAWASPSNPKSLIRRASATGNLGIPGSGRIEIEKRRPTSKDSSIGRFLAQPDILI